MNKITSFKQIKDIIEPIPKDKFQRNFFGKRYSIEYSVPWNGEHCFLGHIHRYFGDNEIASGDRNGFGARQLTRRMLEEVHDIDGDGVDVNDSPFINGYNEPEIKDRIMHMIEDGIKWEESKQKQVL